MLLSAILYGSRARGDHRPMSDVDILGVTEGGLLKQELKAGGTSVYHYPYDFLLAHARSGNLFVFHVVTEGIILHDTADLFEGVKREFNLKANYREEIENASLVAQFFLSRPKLLTRKSARKRLIWAIRSILIARSAENKVPRFSSASLEHFSAIGGLKNFLDNRKAADTLQAIQITRKVLERFGAQVFIVDNWPEGTRDQRGIMFERGGIVRDTLKFVQPISLVKGKPHSKTETSSSVIENVYE